MGMDRYHWTLVTSGVVVYLIPKQTPLRLGEQDALRHEPQVAELARYVDPFRNHILTTYFSMEEQGGVSGKEQDG